MSTFATRLRKARLEAGLSQDALAQAMSQVADKKLVSRSAIAQWESSKSSGIEAANLLKATKVLNVTPDWLQFGYGNMRPDYANFLQSACVPLLSYSQAVNDMNKEKEFVTKVGLDGRLAKIASPNSFALVINDRSMAPIFMPDDLIVIDPAIKPQPGEFVAAKLREDNDLVVFRKYRPLSSSPSKSDTFELIALNEDWVKITIQNKSQGEIIGTLIEHRCRRRIHEYEDVMEGIWC